MKKKQYIIPEIAVIAIDPDCEILVAASARGDHKGYIPGYEDDEDGDYVTGDDAR